jgi:hypothetical protein
MRIYYGPCRITVTGVDAAWPQRVVVRVRGGGETVVDGVVGAGCDVDAEMWELALQHQVDGVWRENVRAVVGRWSEFGDLRRQVVRSKDRDWPNDRRERNLVVTLQRAVSSARASRDASIPSAVPPHGITKSSVATQSAEPADAAGSAGRRRTTSTTLRAYHAEGEAHETPSRTQSASSDFPW